MAETPRAGTGDSTCRSWRYHCSTMLNRQGNPAMSGTFLISSLSPHDNRGWQPQHEQHRLLSRWSASFCYRWVHLDTVSRQIFGNIQETQLSGSKMEVHVHLKNAFPCGIWNWAIIWDYYLWFASHPSVWVCPQLGRLQASGPGQFLGSWVVHRVLTIRLAQWLGWVVETQEKKKGKRSNPCLVEWEQREGRVGRGKGGITLVGPQEELCGPNRYTPRGFTSSPGREAKWEFSGFITTNKKRKRKNKAGRPRDTCAGLIDFSSEDV